MKRKMVTLLKNPLCTNERSTLIVLESCHSFPIDWGNSVRCQICRCSVITILLWFGSTKSRKDFSIYTRLFMLYIYIFAQGWGFPLKCIPLKLNSSNSDIPFHSSSHIKSLLYSVFISGESIVIVFCTGS